MLTVANQHIAADILRNSASEPLPCIGVLEDRLGYLASAFNRLRDCHGAAEVLLTPPVYATLEMRLCA